MNKPVPDAALPILMSRDQMHLGYAETRINGLSVNAPGSDELARVRAAREEILGRISSRDLAAFRKAAKLSKTPAQRPVDALR
jgi:hypothetical protein